MMSQILLLMLQPAYIICGDITMGETHELITDAYQNGMSNADVQRMCVILNGIAKGETNENQNR